MKLHIGSEVFDVIYTEDSTVVKSRFMLEKPKFITYDTETTGLHIKKDMPFLVAICFNQLVYVFPATKEFFTLIIELSNQTKRVYAHNTTYDMHMMGNILGSHAPLQIKNWGDTMGLARLSFEAVSANDGGHSIGLKYIGKKFIDKHAGIYEDAVKGWIKEEAKARRKVLLTMLKPFKIKAKEMDAIIAKGERFPDDAQEVYEAWQEEYPPVTYKDVPMEIMLPYVAVDVILTKLLVKMALPVVVKRKQVDIMNREFRLITTIYKMERQGVPVDREYLQACLVKLDSYIEKLYTELRSLVDLDSVNQSAKIKEIYEEWLGQTLASSDKQFLNRMTREYKESKEGRTAYLISTLRRLIKWRKNYIVNILDRSAYDGRFYTQLNQFSPVSGRFSSDAQQFPKDRIDDEDGNEIYHPRKAFVGQSYYLDYSQVELRMQGHYTIQFGGDKNLCRAYMPFGCTHYRTAETYTFNSVEGRKRWIELREGHPEGHWEQQLKEGWSVWVDPDTNKPWIPTDVHSSTSLKALEIMGFDISTMTKDELKWWRNIGKRFNFMRNYGGGDNKAAETLEIALEAAKAMNNGYSTAFPLVITYQKWAERGMWAQGYMENELGRRYYINDHWRFYKVANYLIQGSCADYLKQKMIEIDNYMMEHDLWDRLPMYLCVHDELQFANILQDPSLEKHIWAIKDIMEDTPDILLPLVAEVEKTITSWAEKKALLQEEIVQKA